MDEGYAGREAPFENRQMWRLLLARLHPDVGGDHELFLFACALMDSVCGKRRPGPDQAFSRWRGGGRLRRCFSGSARPAPEGRSSVALRPRKGARW